MFIVFIYLIAIPLMGWFAKLGIYKLFQDVVAY